jgi:copper(I)-binding protein
MRLGRRRLLRATLACGLAPWSLRAGACEFWSTTLRVTHPWTHATAEGAPSAIVSMKFDEVRQDDRLIGVETPVATQARLGGVDARSEVDFAIPKGRETLLGEQGTYLLLLGLTQPLEVARAYPLRLVFEKGGVLNTDLTVDYTRFL